jgi:predicted porin
MVMKNRLFGIAVIGVLASPAALAQTVYGIVDVGYQRAKHADGDVNKNFIQSAQQSGGSRFGVRGTEDLGAGTYATYQIEFDVVADTGATSASGMTQRQTFVGMGGKSWGELTLGRQYILTYQAFSVGSPVGAGTFSSFYTLDTVGFPLRVSNAVKYSSPVFGGFSAGALWAPGESTTAGASDNGDYTDFILRFAQGPIGIAGSVGRQMTQAATIENHLKFHQIAAHWDRGSYGLYGGYITRRNQGAAAGATPTDVRSWWFNPVARFGGRHEVYALWGRVRNELATDADAHVMAVTYQHVLSKRTRIYTSLGRVDNDPGSAVELNAFAVPVAAGYDPRGFQLGVVHSF